MFDIDEKFNCKGSVKHKTWYDQRLKLTTWFEFGLDFRGLHLFDLYNDLSVLHVDSEPVVTGSKKIRHVVLQSLHCAFSKAALEVNFGGKIRQQCEVALGSDLQTFEVVRFSHFLIQMKYGFDDVIADLIG